MGGSAGSLGFGSTDYLVLVAFEDIYSVIDWFYYPI
jgi:hypothetical protein